MMFVLTVTCGLLLVTVNSDLVCPERWHKRNTQCYWFSDFNATRVEAKLECELQNSSLVTISTPNTNNDILQHILDHMPTYYWIGLRFDGIIQNMWQWSSGGQVTTNHYKFITWCNGISTACAVAKFNGNNPCYESRNCGTKHRFICEKEKMHSPSCPDDWDELTKCYYNSVDMLSNMDAARFCWSRGARLITVTYNEPSKYLLDNKPGQNEAHWIGLSPYKWDDGTPYNWNNWDDDGPNIGARCTLLQQDGRWHYGFCSEELHYFICQKEATMGTATVIATTTTSIIAPTETPEITLILKSSNIPSTSSVSMMSNTSSQSTVDTTYSSAIANNSSYTEMLVDKTSPTSDSKLAVYLMIGVYSAVGVVFVIFVGLLATCLVLRKRYISRMKNMSIEQETQFSESAPHDGDVDYIYDSPEIVQIDNAEQSQSSPSVDIVHNAMTTNEQITDTSGSTTGKENGQETIARTISPSTKSITIDDVITGRMNSNGEQPQPEVADIASSAAGMAHTSVSPRHVLIHGEVYAEVDMSRKTIGYDDVSLPQTATNAHCKQSMSSEILSPTCNQDANEPPDVEDTSENVYYNESAQPTYSNEDSDHDLENDYSNAVPSDTCDADNSMNGEETYANCGDETGGVTYTEVDLSEPNSNMPTTEEESVVYSDIKM